jgi:hypothetical protein
MSDNPNPIIGLAEIMGQYAATLIGLGVEDHLARWTAQTLAEGQIPYSNLEQMYLKRSLLAIIEVDQLIQDSQQKGGSGHGL